jgi:hypothetical protein
MVGKEVNTTKKRYAKDFPWRYGTVGCSRFFTTVVGAGGESKQKWYF